MYRYSIKCKINQTMLDRLICLSQFLKDALVRDRWHKYAKKHKRPEGQQMAHILTLNMYWATTLSIKDVARIKRNKLFA